MEDIDFWVDFVFKNSNKLQKLGLKGKFGWAFNVFTVGPMAHATLIIIDQHCTICNMGVIRFKSSFRKFFFLKKVQIVINTYL